MGVVASKKELALTSVNYSGILLSPFEFYSEDLMNEESSLSNCFKVLLADSIKGDSKDFKWGLGKIDKDLQKERYSPLYRADAGLVDGQLIDEATFRQIWRKQFELKSKVMKTPPTKEEQDNCENFDLMCYNAIIMHLYGVKSCDKATKENPKKYTDLMRKFFGKSFLNEEEKIKRTLKAMEQEEVDIFLVQEATDDLLSKINKQLFIVTASIQGNSAIILRKNKFTKVHNVEEIIANLPEKLRKEIIWNDNTAIMAVDNFIIFSLHLSSKKEKNESQIKLMCENLATIRKLYPMCHIIAGGDANSFIRPETVKEIGPEWHLFPNDEKDITTMKKRTWMQPQTNKADELASTCRDHLLTTVPMENQRITTIRGAPSSKVRFIPNQEHPCDHFVVSASLTVYR